MLRAAFGVYASAPLAGVASVDSCLMDFDDDAGSTTAAPRASRAAASQPGRPSGGGRLARKARLHSVPAAGPSHQTSVATADDIRIRIADGQYPSADGAVLYDSVSEEGQFTSLSVAFTDCAVTVDATDPELTILLYVGDLAAPRARMRLADVLRQGGRRPLNVRVAAGERVLLKVLDPTGAWSAGVPAMEIVLGWTAGG
jgi:Ca-activated chloride channel family protein